MWRNGRAGPARHCGMTQKSGRKAGTAGSCAIRELDFGWVFLLLSILSALEALTAYTRKKETQWLSRTLPVGSSDQGVWAELTIGYAIKDPKDYLVRFLDLAEVQFQHPWTHSDGRTLSSQSTSSSPSRTTASPLLSSAVVFAAV